MHDYPHDTDTQDGTDTDDPYALPHGADEPDETDLEYGDAPNGRDGLVTFTRMDKTTWRGTGGETLLIEYWPGGWRFRLYRADGRLLRKETGFESVEALVGGFEDWVRGEMLSRVDWDNGSPVAVRG